jgi:lysozyme
MQYSRAGQDLTERFESCRLMAYQDQVGVWTIGWGHTFGVAEGMTCTQVEADAWLTEDEAAAIDDVNAHVTVPLTQGEFDSLVDFAFNLGRGALNNSTLLKDLNLGDYQGAAKEFEKWDHAGGKVVAGLLRRRLDEENEFNGEQPS